MKRLLSVSNSHLIDCTWQLCLGALCIGIYKWAQSNSNDKRANSVAVSEADLLSVYVLQGNDTIILVSNVIIINVNSSQQNKM